MARKKFQTEELVATKSFYTDYTNRIILKRHLVGVEKLRQGLIKLGVDHKIIAGYYGHKRQLYYKDADHDKVLDLIQNKLKVKRIESITRPINTKATTEMLGDRHLMVVKNLPFKKYRYKIVLKFDYDDKKNASFNPGFLKSQSEIGTMRLCWALQQIAAGRNVFYQWGDNYFYVEDEATTSMATLMYSAFIKKIYIYKTYEEMQPDAS